MILASVIWVQALGIAVAVLASGFLGFGGGAALLGVGTAMVYPTPLASIGDVAHLSWRASAVGGVNGCGATSGTPLAHSSRV